MGCAYEGSLCQFVLQSKVKFCSRFVQREGPACFLGKIEEPNCFSSTSFEVVLSVHFISFLWGERAGDFHCLISTASFYLVDVRVAVSTA